MCAAGISRSIVSCLLWAIPVSVIAQELHLSRSAAIPLTEALPNAFRVATGDVNGDGKLDIVVGSAAGVVLLLAQADSQFGPGRVIRVPSACAVPEMALADLDRDGNLDLAVYCASAGQVSIYHGMGDGNFDPPASFEAGSKTTNARGLVAADLNQDGILDLAIGQEGEVMVFLGNGDATFHIGAELKITGGPSPARPAALVVADFNGDGLPDLATANTVYNDELSVFLGTGGGQFGAETKVPTGDRPHDLLGVDFNHDGKLDLAVACDAGLFLFVGDGSGAFQVGPKVLSQDRPLSVASTDLNGDGLPDFVVGDYYNGRISVILNGGDGTFQSVAAVASIGDAYAVVLADMNGDLLPDLVATSYSGSSALLANGRGNGEFDQPIYFGAYPANSFPLRLADVDGDGQPELVTILPGRRSIAIVHQGSGQATNIRREDYPLDGVFEDFNGDGIRDLTLITVPDWRGDPQPGGDFRAAIHVLPGLGDGTFGPEIVTAIDRCPSSQGFASLSNRFLTLTTGDFNGDRVLDIALVNLPAQELQIYHGNGDGTFNLAQRFPVQSGGVPVVADFDGDGISDLAFLDRQLTVYTGATNGDMVKSAPMTGCQFQGAIDKGDFDGDGKPDIFLNCGSDVSVLLNVGAGIFNPTPKATMNAPYGTWSAIADLDGDGRSDVALRNPANSSQPIAILLNDGNGAFRGRIAVPAAIDPLAMIGMDYDGDGRQDLVVVDGTDGSLKVLRNTPPDPAASVRIQ